ncbi:MAG: hypothetical protein PUC42_03875, partial [Bacteroidales bacterium]|nr:hypothetical protein [Bacteroidales bacterium]
SKPLHKSQTVIEENEDITVQFLYLHDDCPYDWDTLAKCRAKYMVIEKPEIVIEMQYEQR